jgi:hypothetical protein
MLFPDIWGPYYIGHFWSFLTTRRMRVAPHEIWTATMGRTYPRNPATAATAGASYLVSRGRPTTLTRGGPYVGPADGANPVPS